jgi:hypothetical protein
MALAATASTLGKGGERGGQDRLDGVVGARRYPLTGG